MGMDSVYRLSVVLGLVDNMSNGLSNVTNNVTASTKSINEAFGTVQKAGAALTGVGAGILGAGIATVKSTFETQDALGELSSLGVTDLKAVENAAKSFSDTWAGTTKSDFITAAYDIKSGIASLTDEGVGHSLQNWQLLLVRLQSRLQRKWALYLLQVMAFIRVHMKTCQIWILGKCFQQEYQQQ